jgi:hypothetical protein
MSLGRVAVSLLQNVVGPGYARIISIPISRKGAIISSVACVSVTNACSLRDWQIVQFATFPSFVWSTTATWRRARSTMTRNNSASSWSNEVAPHSSEASSPPTTETDRQRASIGPNSEVLDFRS